MNPFSKVPFERENSKEFFYAVKKGNIKKVEEFLKKSKFYILEFDYVNKKKFFYKLL